MKSGNKTFVLLSPCHARKDTGELPESLFRQRRLPDEILIGEDSGNHAVHQFLRSLRHQDPETLRYIRKQEWADLARIFTCLALKAERDRIFFSDQGDIRHPGKIAVMSQFMESSPSRNLLICDSSCSDPFLNLPRGAMFRHYTWTSKDIHRNNTGGAFSPAVTGDIPVGGHDLVRKKPLECNMHPFQIKALLFHVQHLKLQMSCSKKRDMPHAKKLRVFTLGKCGLCDFQRVCPGKHSGHIPGKFRYLSGLVRFSDKRRKILFFPSYFRSLRFSADDLSRYFQYGYKRKTMLHDFICRTLSDGWEYLLLLKYPSCLRNLNRCECDFHQASSS